jgi:hypothetical protein
MSRPGYEGFPPKRTQPGAVRSKMQLGLRIGELESELAQVKAERDEAEGLANRSKRRHEVCEAEKAEAWRVCGIWQADHVKAEAERDTALRERDETLAVLADLTRLVGPSLVLSVTPEVVAAKAVLLSMREKADQ